MKSCAGSAAPLRTAADEMQLDRPCAAYDQLFRQPWCASSINSTLGVCGLVSDLDRKPEISPMRGCCAADLNPWAALSELSGGFFGACQQQRTTGLWVHKQLQ